MTVESIFALCIYKNLSHRSRFIELSIPYADLYNNKKAPLPLVDKRAFFNGGGCRIRTRVGLPPNGFQDRPVVTTSVTLRIASWPRPRGQLSFYITIALVLSTNEWPLSCSRIRAG